MGIGLVDYMVKSQTDPETGDVLPDFGVYNDEEQYYKKYKTNNTEIDAMFIIKANAPLNTEVHANVRAQLSSGKVQLLIDAGAEEIIVAFDRQFQQIGDKEFTHLKTNLLKLHNKYKNFVQISFIFDKQMITDYKASPIDEGADKFLKLFKERIVL
jgi:hypothetical protein